jgi:hypothetical protein
VEDFYSEYLWDIIVGNGNLEDLVGESITLRRILGRMIGRMLIA